MMLWSFVRTRFSLLALGEPMEVVWICLVSILVIFSMGEGSVKRMPGCTVRAYLPSWVTTPSCSGPIRWIVDQTSQSTRKPPTISGHQLLPSGRCGMPPKPPPLRRSNSSSDGPRVRDCFAAPSGVGSHGLTGSGFDRPPFSFALPDVPVSWESSESHGPLPSTAKICDPCSSIFLLIKSM